MLNNDVNSKTLSRIELLKLAQTLRVTDADVMTRAELRAAIERARAPEARQQAHPVSWLGKARRVLASVVERGLHLPEAATLIRGGLPVRPLSSGPPPVATVTLARIYAAQGHLVRAIGILDEVLVSDPDHELARGLREELQRLLDQRKEQERRQQAESSAPGASVAQTEVAQRGGAQTDAAPSRAERPAPEEAPPSAAELAASELLGAVPDMDVSSTDEITLAGTAPELRSLEPTSWEPAEAESSAQPVSEPSAAVEPSELEAETRRGSGAPAPLAASAEEPQSAELAAPEPHGFGEVAPDASVAPSRPEASALGQVAVDPAGAVDQTPVAEVAADPAAVAPAAVEPAAVAPAAVEPVAAAPEAAAPVAVDQVATAEVPAVPAAALPVAVEPPRSAGLVLIETSEPGAYLYWELASPAPANVASNGNGGEPHWVCVVTHTPRGARSERREYRFPVQHAAGAVRIEGLPRHAVVRAKLTRGQAPEAPALVVAGSVRVGCSAGGCDGGALKHAQPGFLPHPAADPARLAQRAATHLASAAPLYY